MMLTFHLSQGFLAAGSLAAVASKKMFWKFIVQFSRKYLRGSHFLR